MHPFIVAVALVLCLPASYAQTAMECERYRVEPGSNKLDRSFHRVSVDGTKKVLRYEQASGSPWFFPTPIRIPITWASKDGLRVVATWIAGPGQGNEMQGPVYIADVDFSKLRIRVETFGGLIDFDQVIQDPWKFECRRLN